jgi:hypothetical protein
MRRIGAMLSVMAVMLFGRGKKTRTDLTRLYWA